MKNEIPVHSLLYPVLNEYSYADSFTAPIRCQDVASWELIAALFHSAPPWFDRLALLRDRIVYVFGLKTGDSDPKKVEPPYRVGQRIGFFRILQISDNEVVLGEDDRHLDFRTSLLVVNQETGARLTVSTLVETKNSLGTAYFSIVKHFHRLIVPIMVERMARLIDEKKLPYYAGRPQR